MRFGRLTAIALLLMTSACGSPTAPSVPNAQGFWRGLWVATACNITGVEPANCSGILTTGPLNLRLTQSDRMLQGFIFICDSEINGITGAVETDGTITLAGSGAVSSSTPMTLTTFQSTINGTVMTGSFGCTLDLGGSNTLSFAGTLKDVSLYSRDPNIPF
jgi:hypothetical protein